MSIEKMIKVAHVYYNTEGRKRVEDVGTLLYLTISGAHLYGCDREGSDCDIKGVFLPYRSNVLNFETSKCINVKANVDGVDIDFECWSFQYLQHLLYKGDSNVIDMLYSQTYKKAVLYSDYQFEEIFSLANLQKYILFNNMTGIVGYSQKQAEKYGVKGTRINEITEFLEMFNNITSNYTTAQMDEIKFGEIFGAFNLSTFQHIKKTLLNKKTTTEYGINVLGRIFPQYLRLRQVVPQIDAIMSKFGDRAMQASEAGGSDWKAMSHAYRAGKEYEQILTEKHLQFPLKDADTIKSIKLGEFTIERVRVELEELLEINMRLDDGTKFTRNKPSLKYLKEATVGLYDSGKYQTFRS